MIEQDRPPCFDIEVGRAVAVPAPILRPVRDTDQLDLAAEALPFTVKPGVDAASVASADRSKPSMTSPEHRWATRLHGLRPVVTVCWLALALGGLTPTAQAFTFQIDAGHARVLAAPGERNAFAVDDLAGGVLVRDLAQNPVSSPLPPGCTAALPWEVACGPGVVAGISLDAGDHDDTLANGSVLANVVLAGGAGNDQISGGAAGETLSGGDGNDTLQGGAGADVADGGDGADRIVGGDGDDWLAGGAGDDRVDGSDGSDVADGGDGADTLTGGDGSDLLSGGAGNDQLSGDDGADTALGGPDADLLDGSRGADVLDGQEGDDEAMGGEGADNLLGGPGADRLAGGSGNDALAGQAGSVSGPSATVVGGDRRAARRRRYVAAPPAPRRRDGHRDRRGGRRRQHVGHRLEPVDGRRCAR